MFNGAPSCWFWSCRVVQLTLQLELQVEAESRVEGGPASPRQHLHTRVRPERGLTTTHPQNQQRQMSRMLLTAVTH